MLKIIFDIVFYGIVPLALVMLIIIAFIVTVASGDGNSSGVSDSTQSAIAGMLAGFVGFVIYAIGSAASQSAFPNFSPTHPPKFHIIASAAGVAAGFCLPLLVELLMDTKAIGISTLILTFTGLAGLYSYLFATSLHRIILYASLSAALGWLLSAIFFRTEAHNLFLGG